MNGLETFLTSGSVNTNLYLLALYFVFGLLVDHPGRKICFRDFIVASFSILLWLGKNDVSACVSLYMGYMSDLKMIESFRDIIKSKFANIITKNKK